MKQILNPILILLTILWLSSCTIQKRLYTGGWNLEWKKKWKGDFSNEPLQQKKDSLNSISADSEIYPTKEIQFESNEERIQDPIQFENNKNEGILDQPDFVKKSPLPHEVKSQRESVKDYQNLKREIENTDNVYYNPPLMMLVIGLLLALIGLFLIVGAVNSVAMSSVAILIGFTLMYAGLIIGLIGLVWILVALINNHANGPRD